MTDSGTAAASEGAAREIGYAPELYETVWSFGVRKGGSVLDVGSGEAASSPFAENGFTVQRVDASKASALPFPDERFDVAISAQTFDSVDRARTLSEMYRVLRRGGVAAVWWRQLAATDQLTALREDTFKALGVPPVAEFTSGFKEFYASPFAEQTLRVIPWRTSATLAQYVAEERSNPRVRTILGENADRYLNELQARLQERFGHGNPRLAPAYVHFLYLARKP
ncbi:MAG TPA: class I SAM-dependent methyltransferase [Candidatus Baltobacteraceae bacterium]|nr:class I SAM-dependent methyltransferase [Candidatus Baltobacteraceae bacterium]